MHKWWAQLESSHAPEMIKIFQVTHMSTCEKSPPFAGNAEQIKALELWHENTLSHARDIGSSSKIGCKLMVEVCALFPPLPLLPASAMTESVSAQRTSDSGNYCAGNEQN